MAAELRPNQWFADWSEDGNDITIPIASIPGLSAGDADGATGDIRAIIFRIMERLRSAYDVPSPVGDPPANMLVSKSQSFAAGVLTETYTVTIKTNVASQTIVAEPFEG